MKKALIALLFILTANIYSITPNQALVWLQVLNNPHVQHRLKYVSKGGSSNTRRPYIPLARPATPPSYPWRLY